MTLTCLCAEDITECAIYPCKHTICSNCCLKFRALMNDLTCPYCRDEPVGTVHIVSTPDTKVSKAQLPLRKHGILVETEKQKKRLESRLELPCPVCRSVQHSFKTMKQHFAEKHPAKTYCRVCSAHEFVFTDELEVFTHKGLSNHTKEAHAICPFCDWTFYSNKELDKHCKSEHEYCFICERLNPERPQYFNNYLRLKDHFMDEHYMCMVPSCLEDKFIVFGSKIELQNHMLEEHKSFVNVKQMQQVDIHELQSGRSKSSTPQPDEPTMAKRRYTERLRIAARNDNGLTDQIMEANHTFETKKVPVDVFIKTYSNVLPQASEDEITLLIDEFSKFAMLPENKLNQLNTALIHRRPIEPLPTGSLSKPKQTGPSRAPVSVPYGQWVGRKTVGAPGPGGINTANLPRLGGGSGPQQMDYLSAPPKIPINRPKPKPKTPALPTQNKPLWGNGPQTRLPALGAPRSTRPTWLNDSDLGSNGAAPSSSGSATPSSSSSVASASSSRSKKPNFANLPTLPNDDAGKKKKGTKAKVVRIT